MRLNAFILALCVCVYHTRAASINVPESKLDALDDVDLDNAEQETVVNQQNLKKANEDIPVKVAEEQVVNENSNDYVPDNDDSNINVKRIEVDLRNPGLPQRQEHETQNPDSYSDKEKAIFAIKSSIVNAEKVFNEGLQGVSNGFKTIFSPEENLPQIQKSINNLKETFTGEIEKINYAIRAQIKPQTVPSPQTSQNNIEIAESRLKVLEKTFVTGVDALSEGVELYSIIKEDEAGKTAEVRADIENTAESQPSPSPPALTNPSSNQPATGPPAVWPNIISQFQNAVSSSFNGISSVFSNGFNPNPNPNANTNNSTAAPGNIFQGFGIFQGQSQTQPSQPPNVQSDTPEPQQNVLQSITTSVQNFISNSFPGQNNNQGQNSPPSNSIFPSIQNRPITQILQGLPVFSYFQPTQTSTSTNAPTKQPESSSTKKPDADEVQSGNTVPARTPAAAPAPLQAPASQPIQQAQAAQVPFQPGPIQQLVQNNPIIKGLQSAVQRIQGTPNPETPREEVVQDKVDIEDGNVDSKGHYGGNRPNNVNNVNQGSTNDSGGVEEKLDEVKAQKIPSAEDIKEEKINAEQLKTPSVSDKTQSD